MKRSDLFVLIVKEDFTLNNTKNTTFILIQLTININKTKESMDDFANRVSIFVCDIKKAILPRFYNNL